MINSGLANDKKDEIAIDNKSGIVTIRNLETDQCKALVNLSNLKKHLGRKLFCKGIVELTPTKTCQSP